MPTIHISEDLMEEIKAHKRSKDEPPTATLQRMLELDTNTIEEIVEEKITDMVVAEALVT